MLEQLRANTLCLCRPPKAATKGKVTRRLKSARPMFRGHTCFSPAALHRHWYREHPFLRGPTPEVGLWREASIPHSWFAEDAIRAWRPVLPICMMADVC